jgi:hypothetical protein
MSKFLVKEITSQNKQKFTKILGRSLCRFHIQQVKRLILKVDFLKLIELIKSKQNMILITMVG